MRLNMVYLPHLLISLRGTLEPIHFDLREVFWYTDRSVYWKTSLKPIQEKGGFKRGFLGLAHPSLKPCPPLYFEKEGAPISLQMFPFEIFATFRSTPRHYTELPSAHAVAPARV